MYKAIEEAIRGEGLVTITVFIEVTKGLITLQGVQSDFSYLCNWRQQKDIVRLEHAVRANSGILHLSQQNCNHYRNRKYSCVWTFFYQIFKYFIILKDSWLSLLTDHTFWFAINLSIINTHVFRFNQNCFRSKIKPNILNLNL